MSMIRCPECQSEVSAQATACPKCGYPFVSEPDTVIITPTPPPPIVEPPPVIVRKVIAEKKSDFPAWALVPIALALVAVVFGFIWISNRNQTDANDNANARLRETAMANSRTTRTTIEQTPTTINPPSSAGATTVVPPSTTTLPPNSSYPNSIPPPSAPTTLSPAGSETVVTTAPPTDKGNLALTATILTSKGTKQPVTAEKFYLLSSDLETILSKAGIESTEGSYASTLGAAIADPNRKDELQKCLAAIKPYIIESTTSDSTGRANFKNIKTNNYYLFGVHKTGNSASVWNTSVTLNPGENTIALNGSAPATTPPGVADSNY